MATRVGRHTPAHRGALLEQVRSSCENRPGTYRMLAEAGRVLYVGKSRALRTRLLSYFRAKGRRNKSAKILRHTFTIEWHYAPNEFAALLDELRLIKQHRPHFNSTMVSDEWPRAYVALTAGAVPGLRVVRRTDDARASGLWGPFRRVSHLSDAVHALAEIAAIRDCTLEEPNGTSAARPLWFADTVPPRGLRRQRTPGCLRAEIGSCPGPCIGTGNAAQYAQSVNEVRDFLNARTDEPLVRARERMQAASNALEFERAAVWRDRAELLEWLWTRVTRFHASMDRLSFVYRTGDAGDNGRAYVIRRGTVRAELPLPATAEQEAALQELSRRIFHEADPRGSDVPMHDLDEFYLVASWFRRRPDELLRTTQPSA